MERELSAEQLEAQKAKRKFLYDIRTAIEDYHKTMEVINQGKLTKSYAEMIIEPLAICGDNMCCYLVNSPSLLRVHDLYEPYEHAFNLLFNLYNSIKTFLESS